MQFVAIDVETANARRRSICQIGLVTFENDGSEIAAEGHLVDPRDPFDPFNIGIHGIDARAVTGAPGIDDLAGWIRTRLEGRIVVSHTPFDLDALSHAFAFHGLDWPECLWIDTAEVARNAWPHLGPGNYRLAELARRFDIAFKHHDALEDARTAGLIMIRAVRETSVRLAHCVLDIAERPVPKERPLVLRQPFLSPGAKVDARRPGIGVGPLVGETVVFTGNLLLPREEAANVAQNFGAAVDNGVTRRTTILVVGGQDPEVLNGKDKRAKQIKAEELIAKGQKLRILTEAQFVTLLNQASGVPTSE